MTMDGGGSGPRLSVVGRVSAAGKPYAIVRIDDTEVELSPNETRRFALSALRAAEAAIVDSTLVRHLSRVGIELAEIAPMLEELRKARGE